MDARPLRLRGSENPAPTLHQRHKSTGNLADMYSTASTAGFRGPAKRAAFGDVTNLSTKNANGANEDHKIVKVQSVAHVRGLAQVHGLANKENVQLGKKESLVRPAHRPAALGIKSKNLGETRPRDRLKKPDRAIVRQQPSQVYWADNTDVGYQANIEESEEQSSLQPVPVESAFVQPPRHHKSQPQLKEQRPNLRRTQSRHLERTDIANDRSNALNVHSDILSVQEEEPVTAPREEPEIVETHTDRLLQAEIEHLEHYADLHPHLPEISEEPQFDSATFKDGRTPGLSEPEEYWDEDEEEYEDHDQAYTTAHSVQSAGMTIGGNTTILQPKVTTRVQRELEEARVEVLQTRPQEDIEDEAWDISMVAEYGDEIFDYMRELEVKMSPNPHYMDIQTEIQWSMRSVLMDWLVQVHKRFSLLPETLFLTVNYIDRFLSSKVVSIGKLQLVGATAILVASKYEEINCPSLQEIVYMVDGGYTTDEILKAERFMLSMLSFELGWPGPMSFLRRVSKADDYDLDTRTLAKYFLELTIMDERFVATPPSFVAAAAHCLSRLILNKGDWSKQHVHYSGYTWSQLKSLVTMMIGCCEQPRLHHGAIFDKYAERRFKEASTIVQDALDAGFTLPHQTYPIRSPEWMATNYEAPNYVIEAPSALH